MNNFIMDQTLVNVAVQGPMGPIAGRTQEDAEALDFGAMLQQLRTADGADAPTAPRAASKEDAEPETPTKRITDERYAIAMALMFQPRPEVRCEAPEAETPEVAVPVMTVQSIDTPEIVPEAKPETPETRLIDVEAPVFERRVVTHPQEAPQVELETPHAEAKAPQVSIEARGAGTEAPARTAETIRVEAQAPQTGSGAARELPQTRTIETKMPEARIVETEAPQATVETPAAFEARIAETPEFEAAEAAAQPIVTEATVARETPELVIETAQTPEAKQAAIELRPPTARLEASKTVETRNFPERVAEQVGEDAPELMSEAEPAEEPTPELMSGAEPAEESTPESQSEAPAETKGGAKPESRTEPRVDSRNEAPTEAKTETVEKPRPVKAEQPEPHMQRAENEAPRTAKAAVRTEDETEPKQTAEAPETPVFTRVEAAPVKVAESTSPIPLEAEDGARQLGEMIGDTLIYRIDKDRIEIKLAPETLGKLTVELARGTDGTLSVVLHAENERTAAILDKNMDGLRTALMSNTGREVEVQVQRGESSQQQFLNPDGQNRQGREQQQQQQQHGRNAYRRHEAQEFLQQLRLGLVSVSGAD